MTSRTGGLSLVGPVFLPAAIGFAAYTALKINWNVALRNFLLGPGRNSRILLILFAVLNWKCLPLAWTVRKHDSSPQDDKD
jgi:hypothetical protein